MKTVYKISESNFYDFDNIAVGDEVILIERSYTLGSAVYYYIVRDNGKGIGGNLNSNIKCYHGWRGTTNDWAIYALGLRRVERIDPIKYNEATGERTRKIKLSADLKPNEL